MTMIKLLDDNKKILCVYAYGHLYNLEFNELFNNKIVRKLCNYLSIYAYHFYILEF